MIFTKQQNKVMFGFASLLVEQGIFEEVRMYFLIVGHTHGCLDRYFSHLSKYIKNATFIGSPLSLQHLFETGPSEDGVFPAVNRQVRCFFDWKTFLTPFLNKHIRNHQVPHVFRFKKIFGRCYMQYKLYSSFDHWLPQCPPNIVSMQLLENAPAIASVQVMPLTSVGGFESLAEHMGIPSGQMDLQSRILRRVTDVEAQFREVYTHIINSESKGYAEDLKRLIEEEENMGFAINHRFNLQDNEFVKLETINTEETGFIFWLDQDGKKPTIDLNSLPVIILDGANPNHVLKAQGYSRVAVFALTELDDKHYGISQTFQYTAPMLTQEERAFYQSIDTHIKAISKHNQDVEAASLVPYSLFPLDHLSESQREVLLTRKLRDYAEERIAIGKTD